MNEKTTRSAYIENFVGDGAAPERQKEALKQALDIRKFETDLYWKRASYFWTFIAGMFAGYFLLTKDPVHAFEPAYTVACLGLTFSIAWYFVNRGSKAWQRNWEIQVDLLEDEIMGPLYKSALNRQHFDLWDITAGYPFSPSKINQILGVFVCATTGVICITVDKLLGGSGVAGAAASSTAGNSAAVPKAIAAAAVSREVR